MAEKTAKGFSERVSAADLVQAQREELVARIARALPSDGYTEPFRGLRLYRASAPTDLSHGVYKPTLCVIAQGSKQVFLGEARYRYDPAHYLIATVELPTTSQIVEASLERPYLSLSLDLDLPLVGSVMVEAGHLPARRRTNLRAMDVSPLDADLLDAVLRLVRLVETPAAARFLLPLITREIIYRLLTGRQGERLCQIVVQGGQTQRIAQAVERLRTEFDQPLRMEEIAREMGMSVSGFHQHFKSVTGMSPLQFQKRQRLQEARRLLLGEDLDAATVAWRVGYEDASHFSREYKRLFGAPPMRDVERLRQSSLQQVSLAAD